MTKTIEINQIYVKGTEHEFESCVQVADYLDRSKLDLVDPNEKVTDLERLNITFDYPLTTPVVIGFSNAGGFTRMDLFRVIYEGYKSIYDREEIACGKTDNIPGMLNRQTSGGPFGIWGHYMGDLFIEAVEIYDDGTVELGMGS